MKMRQENNVWNELLHQMVHQFYHYQIRSG